MTNEKKRYLFYWLSFIVGYIFPFIYYICRLGITKKRTTIVIPILFIAIVILIKLCRDIPKWTHTWKPSFWKGIVRSIPIYLTTIILITFGLTLKVLLKKEIELAFNSYFEFVLVFFGALCISTTLEAYHLKYKELDMLDKGYVMGTVNKNE